MHFTRMAPLLGLRKNQTRSSTESFCSIHEGETSLLISAAGQVLLVSPVLVWVGVSSGNFKVFIIDSHL